MSDYDAVIGRLDVIGEKLKGLPPSFRQAHPELDPGRFWGMRDILIHQYAKDDNGIVLAAVRNRLAATQAKVREILVSLCS